jgi:hypothetical protein
VPFWLHSAPGGADDEKSIGIVSLLARRGICFLSFIGFYAETGKNYSVFTAINCRKLMAAIR